MVPVVLVGVLLVLVLATSLVLVLALVLGLALILGWRKGEGRRGEEMGGGEERIRMFRILVEPWAGQAMPDLHLCSS